MTVQQNLAGAAKPTAKDFATDQEVRWCPGCGDYAILKAMQKTLADEGVDPEKTVFVSGIGCAARFPYYMETYGFHTIHGRAPAVATGVKLANPDLDVWVISGDGDALSIGGNHLIHALRRNVDLQILLFNNEIYGLTKGQYSPTSRAGTRTPSSPGGSIDRPLSAGALALGAGASFFARAVDTQQKPLSQVLKQARAHRGTALVEIFQNCIVYNPDVFAGFTDRSVADDAQLHLVHGEPLIFGRNKDRGLRLKPGSLRLEVVDLAAEPAAAGSLLVHDEQDPVLANMLVALEPPHFPVAMGVIYCQPRDTYEAEVARERQAAAKAQTGKTGPRNLEQLLHGPTTWQVT